MAEALQYNRVFIISSFKANAFLLLKGGQKLTKTQTEVFSLIKENNQMARDELSKALGIYSSAVQMLTDKIKGKGFMKRMGGDKSGYWEIKEDER